MLYAKGQAVTLFVGGISLVIVGSFFKALLFHNLASVVLVALTAGLCMAIVRKPMYTFNSIERLGSYQFKKKTRINRALQWFFQSVDTREHLLSFLFWQIVFKGAELSVTVGLLAILQHTGNVFRIASFGWLYVSVAIAVLASAFVVGYPNRNAMSIAYGALGNPQDLP